MATRIRRAVVAAALTLIMATVLAGVAWAATLVGTDEPDRLVGSPNNDKIFGYGGNDRIQAGEGDDYIKGGGGNDFIQGRLGDDHIILGPGADAFAKGGGGNDIMEADDGRYDSVECGGGENDHAYIDVRPVGDGLGNCEYVNGKKMNWDTFEGETWPKAPPKDQREY
jgi:Ca2+-binding RTX toxin-like protein